jgi:hypothetical protein
MQGKGKKNKKEKKNILAKLHYFPRAFQNIKILGNKFGIFSSRTTPT